MLKIIILAIIFLGSGGLLIHAIVSQLASARAAVRQLKEEPVVKRKYRKALVVYYSLTGNTQKVAERIKNAVDGDIYEIKLTEDYPGGPKVYWMSKKQIERDDMPALKDKVPDFSAYDVIFVGGPVWWYTVPPPLRSFLSQANFQGKAVIPFATHGGNIGKYFVDFKERAKNAAVMRGEEFRGVSKTADDELDQKIKSWLELLIVKE